MTDNASKMV